MAGGQAPGKYEVAKTSVNTAFDYLNTLMKGGVLASLPKFYQSYAKGQQLARLGSTQRKDMPVITEQDVKKFQQRLLNGSLDVKSPFALGTPKNPFPEGLTGSQAQKFLTKGLMRNDGDANDDKVKAKIVKVQVGKLKPIQQQIYFDKSVGGIAEFGVESSKKFMKSTFFIGSADNFIIDGHHRWLGSIILDPNMMVQVLQIALPIKYLLPLSLAYGDAIGNKRNL